MAATGHSKYTLRYFDARGAAEVSRILFAVAGVEYDDHRYGFTFGVPGDFSTISRPAYDADKANGVFDQNLGRVPLLEVDGVGIGQSKAIERFLARRFGLFGTSDIETAQIDAIAEHVRDIKDAWRKTQALKDTEKQEATAKWFAEDLPGWFGKLEKVVGANGVAVGTKTSLADIALWSLAADSFPDKDAAAAAIAPHPKLVLIRDHVAALPGLQGWLQKRPLTAF